MTSPYTPEHRAELRHTLAQRHAGQSDDGTDLERMLLATAMGLLAELDRMATVEAERLHEILDTVSPNASIVAVTGACEVIITGDYEVFDEEGETIGRGPSEPEAVADAITREHKDMRARFDDLRNSVRAYRDAARELDTRC